MSTILRSTPPSTSSSSRLDGLPERIVTLFSDALHLDVPSLDTDLFETGILDSLAFVELLLHLEREFGVTTSVADLEVENFSSITRIADFVMMRAAAAGRGVVVRFGRGRGDA